MGRCGLAVTGLVLGASGEGAVGRGEGRGDAEGARAAPFRPSQPSLSSEQGPKPPPSPDTGSFVPGGSSG